MNKADVLKVAGEPVANCIIQPLRGNEYVARHEVAWRYGNPVAGPLYTEAQLLAVAEAGQVRSER